MKLFLIDGHALVFKMYYAFLGRPMVNSKGVDTSILFGFTKYLLELIVKEKPTHLAISFDPPGGTFRNVLYPEYKANRAQTPQLVIDALEPLTKIAKALDIPVLTIPGFEADDVIGSAAKRFAGEGMEVWMVTPDKDYGQLVDAHTFQYKPGKSGTDHEVLGEREVCQKWGIASTSQVIDMLAICGDTSDNVPGVSGIGPVGAAKLLQKYGSLEGIYSHIDELSPNQRSKFAAARDHIALSKRLVTIKTDIPLPVSVSDLVLDTAFTAEVDEIFKKYEFPSLVRLVKVISADLPSGPEVKTPSQTVKAVRVGVGALDGGEVAVLPGDGGLYVSESGKVCFDKPEAFRSLLENPGISKVGTDLKGLYKSLKTGWGIELRGTLKDIGLMHYVLNPERSHKLETIAQSYLGVTLNDSTEASTGSLFDEPEDEKLQDQGDTAVCMVLIAEKIWAELCADESLMKLYRDVEEPLIRVLAGMELCGVKVDIPVLGKYADSLRVRMFQAEARVKELAGDPGLNVSSPRQVGTVIFEKLQLDPKAKKPRSGNWPTDEQTLMELADRSPIIGEILKFRGLKKLLGTYLDPFKDYVDPRDGRVHTTFNQALTATGRLSSSNPNLQNIPIRTDDGREIRRAFVPGGEGRVMMSADYSQIELRLMAHFCGDDHMCEAFRSGEDVHRATAAKIFNVGVDEVTAEQRRTAKTANFGIMYGISSFGLSQRLKCSRTEAKKIIDDYFESFPSIRSWMDTMLAQARQTGYVETLFGRRRYVPDLNAANATVRALAERNAVNAPIQGTSADIIKLAMIRVSERLLREGLKARMVLQIHDELVLEVPDDEIDAVERILIGEMEGVIALSVPLIVECNYGKTWLEAH